MTEMTKEVDGTKMMGLHYSGGMGGPLRVTSETEEDSGEVLRLVYKLTDSDKFNRVYIKKK